MTDQHTDHYVGVLPPRDGERYQYESLGAGVQSTCMAVMVHEGLLPPLDAAIFSDTGWEFPEVYEHLDALTRYLAEVGTPVYIAKRGNLADDVLNPLVFATIPCWTKQEKQVRTPTKWGPCPSCTGFRLYDGYEDECEDCRGLGEVPTEWEWRSTGKTFGKVIRQCTPKYKVEPLEQKLRELLGARVWIQPCRYCQATGRRVAPWDPLRREGACSVCRGTGKRRRVGSVPEGVKVDQWIGFSADEWERATDVGFPSYSKPRHPLLELGWTRTKCIEWMAEKGWRGVAKSACMGCPFHDDDTWLDIADRHPAAFAQLCEFDTALRADGTGMEADRFLHERRVPLAEAVAEYRSEKERRGDQQWLWPEMKPKRQVRHCNPFGCRREDVDNEEDAA